MNAPTNNLPSVPLPPTRMLMGHSVAVAVNENNDPICQSYYRSGHSDRIYQCWALVVPGETRCAYHRERMRAYQASKVIRQRQLASAGSSEKPKENQPPKDGCHKYSVQHKNGVAKKYYCGKPTTNGHRQCEYHLEIARECNRRAKKRSLPPVERRFLKHQHNHCSICGKRRTTRLSHPIHGMPMVATMAPKKGLLQRLRDFFSGK